MGITTETMARQRIEQLRDVFAYSLEKDRLSISKRICLTQERVALMRFAEDPEKGIAYQIPNQLNKEVIKITEVIRATNWQKKFEED